MSAYGSLKGLKFQVVRPIFILLQCFSDKTPLLQIIQATIQRLLFVNCGRRGRKVLEVRTMTDEERIQLLENELEVTILFGEEADRKYEEV